MWDAVAAIGSVMGGLSGIFGRKKNPSPRDNIMSQAAGARDAAAAYGFNPLTMLQYGNPGGTGLGASAPPLASFDMLTQGFKEIGDITSGDADRRREQEDLKHELAKLEIERLRAGKASDALGGVSPLGRNASIEVQSNTRDAPPKMGGGDKRTLRAFGVDWEMSPDFGPSQGVEDEYAELISIPYGVAKLGADAWHNFSLGAEARAQKSEAAGIPRKTWGGLGRAIGVADNEADDPKKWSAYKMRQEFGAAPDGYTPDGLPFWKVGNGISMIPPNKRKAN